MLNRIVKLNGAQMLSKTEQKTINGGWACVECPPGCKCQPNGTCLGVLGAC